MAEDVDLKYRRERSPEDSGEWRAVPLKFQRLPRSSGRLSALRFSIAALLGALACVVFCAGGLLLLWISVWFLLLLITASFWSTLLTLAVLGRHSRNVDTALAAAITSLALVGPIVGVYGAIVSGTFWIWVYGVLVVSVTFVPAAMPGAVLAVALVCRKRPHATAQASRTSGTSAAGQNPDVQSRSARIPPAPRLRRDAPGLCKLEACATTARASGAKS
jgi:MFS family permease